MSASSNAVVEVTEFKEIKKELSIDSGDVERVANHLQVIKEFVSKTLKEGEDKDYGLVPGVKKKMLFKPGAEKLMKLFGLGVRFKVLENELDRYENFALYSYEAEIYHLKTGVIISQCEGTANSQEKKFKEKAVYAGGKKVGTQPVLVCDIINTLKKMAQKRAMVGAVIIATGASDYFSQDEEEVEAQAPVKRKAQEVDSERFTNRESKIDHAGYVVPVGKFKGNKLGEIDKKKLEDYCVYTTKQNPSIDGKLKEFIDTAREYLRGA